MLVHRLSIGGGVSGSFHSPYCRGRFVTPYTKTSCGRALGSRKCIGHVFSTPHTRLCQEPPNNYKTRVSLINEEGGIYGCHFHKWSLVMVLVSQEILVFSSYVKNLLLLDS